MNATNQAKLQHNFFQEENSEDDDDDIENSDTTKS